ncbi:hypothetical protein FSP39_023840 [Pinctada imbricata]|uniref:General transcription factor 3C polypeptide 3 n=1 Tax=Pinctada imbricata TaxID=66713 RepID=A0AA88XUF8_PINIB|nr:hypothetical protein FSP39_023840 [Pinctada imbricata]
MDDGRMGDTQDEAARGSGVLGGREYITLTPIAIQPSTSSDGLLSSVVTPVSLNEPTVQYLQGLITFQQLSELLERREEVEEEQLEVMPVIEGVTEVVTTSEAPPPPVSMETVVDEGESMETEQEQQSQDDSDYSPRKRKTKPKRKFDLPRHLEGLMGQANILFAKGEHQEAMNICLEIIRMAPQAVLPFQTLAMLYEEQGDQDKHYQFSLIAAYLNPSEVDQWIRLAELSIERDDLPQAIKCYSEAIKSDNTNHTLYLERSKLYEEVGNQKKALEGYKSMLRFMPKEEGEMCMNIARSISKLYFEQDQKVQAMETMQNAFMSNPEWVTSEDVNLLLELQMDQKQYYKSVDVLVKFCGVSFVMDNGNPWDDQNPIDINDLMSEKRHFLSCTVPDILPIDLRVKLIVCIIFMKRGDIVEEIIDPLYDESVDDVGDLYLDIAEMYMEMNMNKKAKPLLQRLVCSANYSLAAVWLRYAECLNKLGEIGNAAQAYGQVIELAPSHVGARMTLSSLQQKLGKHEEAIQTLDRSKCSDTILYSVVEDDSESVWSKQEVDLYFQRCRLLYSQGNMEEFYKACKQLLFNHIKDMDDSKFLKTAMCFRSLKFKNDIMPTFYKTNIKQILAVRSEISTDDLWDLYVKMCNILCERGRYDELLIVTCVGMSHPYFTDDPRRFREKDNNQVWNMMNQVLMLANESKHCKFCLRFLLQNPDHIAVSLLNGHNAFLSGTYMFALGEYVAVLRNKPNMPLIHLCIGLTFFSVAIQKYASKKHQLVSQGLAFLNSYMQLRGECQESYYNMGRALHQLGLNYAAVHYYKKVLDMPPVVEDAKERFDLKREAAYNLLLIYKTSGSKELARELMHKYLVI